MRRKERIAALISVISLAFLNAAADVVPTAFVSEAERAIVVSGERVELDAASCFDAWAGGEKPGETEREAAYAQ